MTEDLTGRLALVTGSSSGLGLATACNLMERGARVVLSSRGGQKLDAACDRLSTNGTKVSGYAAELGDPRAIETMIEEIRRDHGEIDILVANGGDPPGKAALDLTDEDWEANLAPVLLFVPRLCRLVVPSMRDRGWGRVVAINSIVTRQPIPSLALSNTLRPAVVGYLKTLSHEVAAHGVTVNAVLPGYTSTERQEELLHVEAEREGRPPEDVRADWVRLTAAKRMARPDEVSRVIAFLCSEEASYVTGQTWVVDGGYVKAF